MATRKVKLIKNDSLYQLVNPIGDVIGEGVKFLAKESTPSIPLTKAEMASIITEGGEVELVLENINPPVNPEIQLKDELKFIPLIIDNKFIIK